MTIIDYGIRKENFPMLGSRRFNNLPLPELPPDLLRYKLPLQRTYRFQDEHYPRHILVDSVYSHTCRTVATAIAIGLGEQYQRMLWIHDIPEIVEPVDTTSYAMLLDPSLRERKEELEAIFCQRYFSQSDQRLMAQYDAAGAYLRGSERHSHIVESPALLTKICDLIDGHVTFHFTLSEWTRQADFVAYEFPREDALLMGLRENQQIIERLSKTDSPYAQIAINLLSAVHNLIYLMWYRKSLPFIAGSIHQFFLMNPPVIVYKHCEPVLL